MDDYNCIDLSTGRLHSAKNVCGEEKQRLRTLINRRFVVYDVKEDNHRVREYLGDSYQREEEERPARDLEGIQEGSNQARFFLVRSASFHDGFGGLSRIFVHDGPARVSAKLRCVRRARRATVKYKLRPAKQE